MVEVLQASGFRRAYKRLHPNQKADVDDAVAAIVADPTLGEAKKGDLAGVLVGGFKSEVQQRYDASVAAS